MLGVPWLAWAGLAGVVASLFAVGVGVPANRPNGARGAIVRWGHAVAWLAFAAMFVALSVGPVGQTLAVPFGLVALATYATFLAALLLPRRGQ
jgi:hypothetical protein